MAQGALSDLRVLELGEFVSAPWCGKLLSGLGAEVIKVEPPGGDKARRVGPFPGDIPHPEKSGLFLYLNTDKLSVTLDVTQPTGRRLFLELVREVDLVLDNHHPDDLRAWGLDYPHLQEVNPRVILTSITPFGWEGPWANYKGNDLVVFHTSGTGYETPFGYVTDPENEPPLKGAEYQTDMTAGWTAASATMMALRHQQQYGEGQLVDVSAQEAFANMLRRNIGFWTYAGVPWEGRLKRGPRGGLACKDGYVSVVVTSDAHWENMKRMMGNPEWAESELFATSGGRWDHNTDALDPLMEEFFADYTKSELFEMCQRERVPLFPLNDAAEVLNSDQYEHRGFWEEVTHPLGGSYQYPGAPHLFSATPAKTQHPAPLLGQHNEEVFCNRLGYSTEDLRDLSLAGMVQVSGGNGHRPAKSLVTLQKVSPQTGQAERPLPLEGVRVVDFGLIIGPPHATQWLAVMGAEVIKIESKRHPENPRSGKVMGGYADDIPGPNRSGGWNSLHYSKKTCSIDMTKEKGRELARRLIATGDIVVENFTTPTTQRFGLTYEELRQVKPDIILLSQSSMGRTGPLKDAVGWGPTNQAYAGLPVLTGYEGGVPQAIGSSWPDFLMGSCLPFMMLAALHHRDRTGEGQSIDFSMSEAVTSMIPQAMLDYQMNGRLREPQGNRDPLMVPHSVYWCAGEDQWVAIAVETQGEWEAFCQGVGHPEWQADERFADAYTRHRHERELDELITEWTRERSPGEVTTWLQAAGVGAGPVLDTLGVFHNPQLRHRGFFVAPDHPEVGPREVMGVPGLYSAIPEKRIQPAPLFDQHNDYVFKEVLGLSGIEVERLIEEEVIY